MIVFRSPGCDQGGLNAISCEEEQSNNLDECSDDSEAKSEKVRKEKKI